MKYILPGEVVFWPLGPGCWLAYNARSRQCLVLEAEGLLCLESAPRLSEDELANHFAGKSYRVWQVGHFSNLDGLLADPTRIKRDPSGWPEPKQLDFDELMTEFMKCTLLLNNLADYEARFDPKTSFLDSEHFGNFHQQLGQEVMLRQRQHPEKWWLKQKFNEDFSSTRPDSLYDAVQADYLQRYFPKNIKSGELVVDLGCGIGYFSNLMALAGGQILGVDPNPKYIELATSNAAPGADFKTMAVGSPGGLAGIADGSADIVFMSDALLLYFFPENPFVENGAPLAELNLLFADIRRILKPGGRFINMEPHYLFWLAPWLGDVERPFTLITEYTNPKFKVTPSFSQLIQAYVKGGFVVTWMEEVLPREDFREVDSRAYHFAKEFPLWQLFELRPA